MMIPGVRFYRLKARISQRKLAELAGVSICFLQRMECPNKQMTMSLGNCMRVAEVLHVPVSALLQEYDDSELDAGDKATYPSWTANLRNCVAVYRQRHGLTLAQLGERLGGKTRACAQLACAEEKPRKKHVLVLTAYEGITLEELHQLYAPKTED